jgi:uncharacterized membrane protein YfcA
MLGTLALLALGLPAGFLIGLIGIGGVLLAPTLLHVFGRDIHEAVALSLASFVLAGIVATAQSRNAETRFSVGDWLFLGMIVPGAIIGALVTPWIPAAELSLVISACVVLAGISCLRGNKSAGTGDNPFHPTILVGMGLLTGLLSVITGSGGPLVCLPMLLWKGMDVRRALILAQVAQLPVAATATLANGLAGSLDLVAAALLSVAIVIGMLVGLNTSRRIDAGILRKCVAWCLVIVGLVLCLDDLQRLAS